MKKISSELMREAHKLTREVKKEYTEVNYSSQLGICIKFLLEEKEKIKETTLTKEMVIEQLENVAYKNKMTAVINDWAKGDNDRTYFKLVWYTGSRHNNKKHEDSCGYWDNIKEEYCLENRYTRQTDVFEL